MRRFLFAPLLLVASSLVAQNYTTVPSLEFANVRGTSFQLDLRVPDGRGPFPAILYLHSGAWITGDRTGGPVIRQATRGYAVASIDYPLAPQFIWPSQIEVCKAAVRWLRANAARFDLDPNRIGVFGTSAGGHLAAILGTSGDEASLEGLELGNAQFSSRVKAVVDFYGPTDLLLINDQKLPCYGLDANSPLMPPSLLIGCPIQQCKDKTATSNPINYITPDDPPFLIMQGTADCLTPYQQSVMLHEALRAAGIDSTLYLVAGATHSDAIFTSPAYQQIVDAWLDAHLRGSVRRRAVRR
ncbi:MAG TPA: alpha/beta hydrolase [Thermoanaerobaculia bacterium]|nr:alpha/beta hydrolase [Thermoanaerobaculia bacterium]